MKDVLVVITGGVIVIGMFCLVLATPNDHADITLECVAKGGEVMTNHSNNKVCANQL